MLMLLKESLVESIFINLIESFFAALLMIFFP